MQSIRQWLTNLKLEILVPRFEASGYSNIETITKYGLDEQDFEYVGVTLPIHKRALRQAVLELQSRPKHSERTYCASNTNSNDAETSYENVGINSSVVSSLPPSTTNISEQEKRGKKSGAIKLESVGTSVLLARLLDCAAPSTPKGKQLPKTRTNGGTARGASYPKGTESSILNHHYFPASTLVCLLCYLNMFYFGRAGS
jgi:hypothetical protein